MLNINNQSLLEELSKSCLANKMTDNLALMFYDMCDAISRHRIFKTVNENDKHDLKQDALEHLLKTYYKFDPTVSPNPFGYFTKIIFRVYFKSLAKERKHKINTINIDIDTIIQNEYE